MNENNEEKPLIDEEKIEQGKLFVDVPPSSEYLDMSKLPSGYDPMGQIYLRGRAFRGLASGQIPWSILIFGWILFGGLWLLFLVILIMDPSVNFLLICMVNSIIPIILWRGTKAKLLEGKRRKNRRKK